jgi:hypothetical protein
VAVRATEAASSEVAEPPQRTRRWGEVAMTGLLLVIGVYLIIDAGRITVPGSANRSGRVSSPTW